MTHTQNDQNALTAKLRASEQNYARQLQDTPSGSSYVPDEPRFSYVRSMAHSSVKSLKKLCRRLLVPAIVLLVISVAIGIYYAFFKLISLALTNIGAAFVLFFLTLYLMRVLILFAIFPGNFRIWGRWIQNMYNKAIARQLRRRVKDLRISVECLANTHVGNAHVEREQLHLIDSSIKKLSHLLKWFIKIFEGMEKEQEARGQAKCCSNQTLMYLQRFKNLKSLLKSCTVTIAGR